MTYTTRDEIIDREILPVLGDYVGDFDLDTLADALTETDGTGYRIIPGVDWDEALASADTVC